MLKALKLYKALLKLGGLLLSCSVDVQDSSVIVHVSKQCNSAVH